MKSFAEYIIPRAVNDPKGTMIVDKNATRVTTSEELISLAYQIANYTKTLPNHGRVVCTLPRSMEYVAAIIGTNLIGTGLAMLSHLEPEARLEMILDDLGTEINIDEAFIEQAKKASNAPVAPVGTLETEALYFFTSGSTGTPKGVIYTNNTVISSLTRTGAAFFLDRDNLIYCSIVPFNFCLSIGELASVLAVEKGCVHLPTDEVRINPVELTKYINTHKITQTFLPPQLCMAMTGDMPSLLAIAVGSEKVVNIGPRSYQMQNGYAMTETAAVDTIFLIDKPYENTPIGKPLSGMEVYLLDENGNESEEGEIYVAGGVAKGYLNLPEETAKTFVPNPFSKGEHDKIMVRTGDLGRRLEDGNILYINRLDWMLKIDGQRIEPGEIEVVCAKMPKIQKIFIKGFVNDRSQTYLCAFYVEKEPFQKEELRKHIEENLPYYMQPKYLVKMDSVPLNANGKVNRLAMKSPEDNIITTVYKAPEGECEKKICQAFERIFSVKQVGRDDDFFRLGGDSIKTTLLLRDLDYPNLKNTDILLGKTPKGIAEIVEKQMEESAIYENFPDESDLHTSPLTDNQMGIYLECISRPNSLAYNIPFFFEFEKNVCADAEALKKMVDECLMAHKALFTKIVQTEQGVVMTLGDVVPVCEVRKGKEEEIAQTIEDFVRPFDLSVAPLCRAMIVETDAKLYLMIDAHHIVFDGTSLILFEEELGNQLQGKAIEPETISPFHLYELEQREKASEQYQEDKAYFDGILAGVEVDSELLPDHKIDGEVDFIKETQDEFYETIRHNKMSFVNIVEEYGVMPTVKFVYQGSGFNEITLPNGSIPLNAVENPHAIGALNCIVIKKDSGYTIVINYRSDLYDESTIARFTKLYERVLKAFSQDAKLQDIEMIEETDSVIYEAGNDTNIDFDESQTVVDLFREQVKKNPKNIAMVHKDVRLTYEELDRESDKVATYVVEMGLKTEEVVSILIPRNEFMGITSLGVLKAGVAYEPLDPTYPMDRIDFMIKDVEAKLLIVDPDLLELVPNYTGEILKTTDISAIQPIDVLPYAPKPDDLLVLLYTSGSTGTPKGCQLLHRNLVAFTFANSHKLELDSNSVTSVYSSFGFDIALGDIYTTLAVGAAAHVIPEEVRLDLDALTEYYAENKLTHVFMTMQVCRQFVPYAAKLPALKYIFTGGESLSPVVLEGNAKLVNSYGPSESICYICGFHVDKLYDSVPIGKATYNVKLYIVDKFGRQVPIGVPGELLISGRQVGRGYHNRPEQTALSFTKNPFSDDPHYSTVYHTGDVVRMKADGNIEFLGRRDTQVKIRGFRVELTEVEAVIKDYPSITDVTVVDRKAPSGGKVLHGYFVASETVNIEELSQFILDRKPSYILPEAMMQLDAIPLTPNFKVDKRKLPEIKTELVGEVRELNMLQQELFDIVEEIVGHSEFYVNTPLDLVGLSSISAMRLAAQVMKQYGHSINVKDLAKHATIMSIENGIVAGLLAERNGGKEVEAEVIEGKYPLNQNQLGIYLDSLSNMSTYDMPTFIKLPTGVDFARLETAIRATVDAHPSMKSIVLTDEMGEPYVKPQPDMQVEITTSPLEENETGYVMPERKEYAFDKPLFSFSILKGKVDNYLLIEIHHIIADGESVTLLLHDIDASYSGNTVESESYTSFQFAAAEETQRNSSEYEKAKAYYNSTFQGIAVDCLPSGDVVVGNSSVGEANEIGEVALSESVMKQGGVVEYCEKHNLQENAFFTSAFAVVLSKFLATDEVVFNQIHNGRNDPRYFSTVGMFVKTMPVYSVVNDDCTIADFMKKTGEHLQALRENELFSFSEATQTFGLKNDIIFAYQGTMLQNVQFLGGALELMPMQEQGNKAPLNIDVYKIDNNFRITINYDQSIYSAEFIASFASAYVNCIKGCVTGNKIGDISLLTVKEEETLKEMHDTSWAVEYKPVYRLLQDTAEKLPDHIAVIAKNEKLTYAELNDEANRVGHLLQSVGVTTEQVVGVMLNRTKYVYIARQGVLKSGGAFLSMDPEYPDDRSQFMLEDAKCKVLLVTKDIYEEKAEFLKLLATNLGIQTIILEEISADISKENLNVEVPEEALAYCIYTSGSTGTPKGVMLTQRNLINFVDGNPKNHEILGYSEKGMVSLAMASITFDVSIMEEFIPLAHGLTICMATLNEIHNPQAMNELCVENKVDIMSCTPSYLLNILDLDVVKPFISQLKSIDFGAEAFTPALYEGLTNINPEIYIMNGYGPTEATVSCTMAVITDVKQITIGIPNSNVKAVILDQQNHPLPLGALGELTILGDGVGRGYVGRPDLTEKVFTKIWDMPAYKSGDFARILPNGNIEFRGRLDHQVKLRGLRVELGEIETAMNHFKGLKSALVVMKESPSGQYLAAYFTGDQPIDTQELNTHLSTNLTPYMVPSVYMQLDEFPLTSNGKINKKLLPDTKFTQKEEVYVAPANEIEADYCEAIGKILGLEKVSATSNFFELGGSSLSASKLAMMAMAKGYLLVYKDVFSNPTPREMAEISSADPTVKSVGEPVGTVKTVATVQGLDKLLEHNTMDEVSDISYDSLGNLLLTGATGYLGMHVLAAYIMREKGTVYCLMRKGKASSVESRLRTLLAFYFEEKYQKKYNISLEDEIGKRIICVEAEVTKEEHVNQLAELPFQTVINCAASVKHFVHDDSLEIANVTAVKHLISLCQSTKRRLIQISTTSVGGEAVVGGPLDQFVLHENQHAFGQILENVYLKTKFDAETAMLEGISNGLDGKIIRVGNLMPRDGDGEFQANFQSSGFMRQLKGYHTLGYFPEAAMSAEVEFSPIGYTALSVVALSSTPSKFTVFHAYNNHAVFMADVVAAMKECGMDIHVAKQNVFQEKMMEVLGDEEKNEKVAGLVSYMDNGPTQKFEIPCNNQFTSQALYNLGISWPITDMEYLKRAFEALKGLGFFD